MTKFLKITLIVAVLVVVAILSYDFYMRNSGLSNRIEYEREKFQIKNGDYNPMKNSFQDNREDRQEERQERREERREKIRKFFN